MVKALTSHHCGPGSIPGLGVICGLSLLLVLVFAPRGFSPGTPVFPSPHKPTFPNSDSIRNLRATVVKVSPSLNKVDRLILLPWLIYIFQFGQVEIVAACLIEHYPRTLTRFRELVVLVLCIILFLLGLSCVTHVS